MKYQCPSCNTESKYETVYDTFYCEQCDIWLESTCPIEDCSFCSSRPEKPSDIKEKI